MKTKKILSFVISSLVLFSCLGFSFVPLSPLNAEATSKTRVSVHDPSIFKDDKTGQYYIFGSHIEAAKSNDLQNWNRFTNGYTTPNNVEFGDLSKNLEKAFAWCGEDLQDCEGGFSVWAPDVIYNAEYINDDGSKGAYMMYFCTSSTYMCSVICYATSQTLEGPYTFKDTLIYSGFTNNDQYVTSSTKNVNRKYTSTNIDELISSGEVEYNSNWFYNNNYNNQMFPNAIDPTIYYDTNGKMYMCYGSWSGGIFTLEIDSKTGKCIHPSNGTTSDGRMIDSYFGTKISGGYGKSGEGPFIEYNSDNGYYYLWVTYGGLTANGGYNMRVFRSKNPTGPFVDPSGKSAVLSAGSNLDDYGLKVMGNYKFSSLDTAYMACGHNSVLCDDDGKWYILYHARFNNGTEFHEVRVHSMQFNSDGWPIVAPNEYSGDNIDLGGYETKDIVGTYEYINHGNDTSSNIHEYSSITLKEDGSISGSVTGTWSEASTSADAVITIDNQDYYGKFIVAQDETGKKVMSFSAIGSNNQTIWGNQTSKFTGNPRDNTFLIAEFIDGSTYRLKNVNSGLYLNVTDNSAKNGTNVEQSNTETSLGSTWRLFSAGDGYYYIISQLEDGVSYALDVTGKKSDNGTNMEIYQYNSADNQKFMLTKNQDGSYKIRTKVSNGNSCVEVINAETTEGANVQQWEVNGANCQDWILEPVTTSGITMDTNVIYTFQNKNSQLVMDIVDGKMQNYSNVQQWGQNGYDCQKWILKPYSNEQNYYYICSVSDNNYVMCVDSSLNGANITIQEYSNNNTDMLFKFAKNLDGSYLIMTYASNDSKIIEVENASNEYGANIQQYEPNGNDCQKWNAVTEVITTSTTETETDITTSPITPILLIGDINLDGNIDLIDILTMKKYLLNCITLTEKQLQLADIVEDNSINILDLIKLKQLIFN